MHFQPYHFYRKSPSHIAVGLVTFPIAIITSRACPAATPDEQNNLRMLYDIYYLYESDPIPRKPLLTRATPVCKNCD